MAFQILNGAGANVTSKEIDVRSVGTRMVPFRVYVYNNADTVTIFGSPTNAAANYISLGTVAAGSGSLVIDEPVDYIKVQTGNAETGANVFLSTSR